jgi:hypothetical protein
VSGPFHFYPSAYNHVVTVATSTLSSTALSTGHGFGFRATAGVVTIVSGLTLAGEPILSALACNSYLPGSHVCPVPGYGHAALPDHTELWSSSTYTIAPI